VSASNRNLAESKAIANNFRIYYLPGKTNLNEVHSLMGIPILFTNRKPEVKKVRKLRAIFEV